MPRLAYDAATKTIVLFGGSSPRGVAEPKLYNDTWTWDGRTWTEQKPARSQAAIVYVAMTGRVRWLDRLSACRYLDVEWKDVGEATSNHRPACPGGGRRALQAAAPNHVASVREHLVDLLTPDQLGTLDAIAQTIIDHLDHGSGG